MAGLGRKVWGRETLSAAELQGYLMDQSVMVFASAAARTTAIPAPAEGMLTYLKDVDRYDWHNGTGWSPLLGRAVPRTGSPGVTIAASGAAETGITSGATALGSFTTYRPGWWVAHFTFRANGSGAAALCMVKINGTQCGDQLISRSDEHVSGHGLFSVSGAGVQTISARVDAQAASVLWSTHRVTLQELVAE